MDGWKVLPPADVVAAARVSRQAALRGHEAQVALEDAALDHRRIPEPAPATLVRDHDLPVEGVRASGLDVEEAQEGDVARVHRAVVPRPADVEGELGGRHVDLDADRQIVVVAILAAGQLGRHELLLNHPAVFGPHPDQSRVLGADVVPRGGEAHREAVRSGGVRARRVARSVGVARDRGVAAANEEEHEADDLSDLHGAFLS